MAANDLRPPGRRESQLDPQPIRGSGSRWWHPLTTKSGLHLFIIFIGLAIGFAEDTVRRFFPAAEPAVTRPEDMFEKWRRLQAELGKLDATDTGNRLIALLSVLPGDDPDSNFFSTHMLAAEYDRKRRLEDAAYEATLSDDAKKGLKANRDEWWKYLNRTIGAELRKQRPNNEDMIGFLKQALGKAGHHFYGFAQNINKSIEEQWKKVAQMPALASEITQLFADARPPSAANKTDIRAGILRKIALYKEADDLRRGLPSYKPDPPRAVDPARPGLDAVSRLAYDDAVKAILENLKNAPQAELETAVKILL